jgi:hypothetical protein
LHRRPGDRPADPFKGQRNLSLRNDFNQQLLETARIATLSQQIALGRGPNSIFSSDRKPPTMLRWGLGGMRSDIAAQN